MSRDKIITAIDVGSSKIATVIASTGASEKVSVIGVSTTSSRGIKKGQVVDIDETVAAISESVDAAERMAGVSIGSAFVCVGGAHIASQNSKGVVAVSTPEGEINDTDVSRVVEAAKAISMPSSREILHVIPRDFSVDGQEGIKDPIGMTGVRLEVETQIVTGASTAIRNLGKCINEVGIDIESVVFSGLASSQAVLSETEKELGVVLVDVGAGTTDVAIWVDGALSYSAVLPVGARNVTNDIAVGLRVGLDSAEKIKLFLSQKEKPQFATTSDTPKPVDEMDLSHLSLPEEIKKISRKTLIDGIIKPRLLEIFTFIGLEIQKSGFGGMTPAGVVITGGGAQTIGTIEACRQRLAMPCRIGVPFGLPSTGNETNGVVVTGLIDELCSAQSATSVGLIIYGSKFDGVRVSRKMSTLSLPNLTGFGSIVSALPLKNILPKFKIFLKGFLP
jgi:cell division protein FtsA